MERATEPETKCVQTVPCSLRLGYTRADSQKDMQKKRRTLIQHCPHGPNTSVYPCL